MNSYDPLVSVIVVAYNSSDYIIDTLQSAYDQTYRNIELIVTDDCSGDNTIDLVRKWAESHKDRFVRFEIVPGIENRGIPANCNKGLKAAQGEWIKFIAGDDILMNNCISDNIAYALVNNASFIFSDVVWFINDKEVIEHDRSEDRYRDALPLLNSGGQKKFYSRYPVFLNSPAWFFSKNKLGFSFNEEFRFLEDQPFIFRLLESGHRIFHMKKNTVWYRRHDKSVVVSNSSKFYSEFSGCYHKYRKNNLSRRSLIDLLYRMNYHAFMAEHRSKENFLLKVLYYPLRKINELIFRFIKPQMGLEAFMVK